MIGSRLHPDPKHMAEQQVGELLRQATRRTAEPRDRQLGEDVRTALNEHMDHSKALPHNLQVREDSHGRLIMKGIPIS